MVLLVWLAGVWWPIRVKFQTLALCHVHFQAEFSYPLLDWSFVVMKQCLILLSLSNFEGANGEPSSISHGYGCPQRWSLIFWLYAMFVLISILEAQCCAIAEVLSDKGGNEASSRKHAKRELLYCLTALHVGAVVPGKNVLYGVGWGARSMGHLALHGANPLGITLRVQRHIPRWLPASTC